MIFLVGWCVQSVLVVVVSLFCFSLLLEVQTRARAQALLRVFCIDAKTYLLLD